MRKDILNTFQRFSLIYLKNSKKLVCSPIRFLVTIALEINKCLSENLQLCGKNCVSYAQTYFLVNS